MTSGIALSPSGAISNHEGIPFEDFIWHHPHLVGQTGPRKRQKTKSVTVSEKEQMMNAYPWLTEEDFNAGGMHGQKRCFSKNRAFHSSSSHEVDPKCDAHVSEDEIDTSHDTGKVSGSDGSGVEEELLALRAEWEFPEGDDSHFYLHVLGGKWTKRNTGSVADAAKGVARAYARDWCAAYSFPKQRAYYYNRYSRLGAHMLAEEFCRRGNHFLNIYLESDEPVDVPWAYTQEQLDSYQPEFEFVSWLSDQHDVNDDCFTEGVKLNKLVPSMRAD